MSMRSARAQGSGQEEGRRMRNPGGANENGPRTGGRTGVPPADGSPDSGPGGRPLAAFAAGAVAVLTVHQAVLWALHRAGWAPWPAYSLAPTRPLGVPAVASAAFWGGAWWAVLATWLPRGGRPGASYARAALLGAVLPNAVGALLVALGHGQRWGATPRAAATCSALLVNGAWGVTAAALLRRGRAGRGDGGDGGRAGR
jgi:hypothetical protein